MSRNPEDPQVASRQSASQKEGGAIQCRPAEVREKMLDKTIADSFPTSDPPSTIPDPESDSFDAEEAIASPYDRLPHADSQDAEHQPLPGDKPSDRQPQPGGKDKAA